MRRSGALTLGAVLMLGGITGGRGDQLSDSVGLGGASSPGGFALPTLPENWADMPFQLTASQSTTYNSNIFSLPVGMSLPSGQPRGDFTSTTSFGLSTKTTWEGQQFFFDGTYGITRYLHQVQDDQNIYAFNAGVNWTLTSRCAGALTGALTRNPSLITEQVGTGINYATTTALNGTAKCGVGNGYSLVLNSGVTKVNNSNALNGINNGQTVLISAGIDYSIGPDSLTALASISNTDYGNRAALVMVPGLANNVATHSFTFNYARQINPNLSVNAQLGLVGVTNGFDVSLPKTLLPIYSFSASWSITPKLLLTANASRTVAPPTTVIANAETSYLASVSLTYQPTPKISIGALASAGYSTASFTPGLAGTQFANFLTNTNYYNAEAHVSYSITPFISAALTGTITERVSDHVITPQDLITVSLNYKPY
jgi:hypothetical protein